MTPDPTSFGSYRLIQALGEGAMGTVWRALDLRLERQVALKILKDVDEHRRRALLAEAKLACQLNHPNIAHIYDAGEVDDVPYIAMELVEGEGLRQLVGRPMPVARLLSIAKQAASALAHAHLKGIVHRDIKPENLVITEDGALKILDFGIARREAEQQAASATSHHMTLIERTAPGYSQGTPAYMSPEQANGLALTGASDQFSLGVVLFELASGIRPFQRETLVETLFAVVKDDPPSLSALRPDLPQGVVKAIQRMLAKRADDRFPAMQSAVTALEDEIPTAAVPNVNVPIGRPAPRLWVLASAALLMAGAGAAGTWLLKGRDHSGLAEARAAAGVDSRKGRRVIAVLPLEQMRPDPDHAWLGSSFADAMTMGLVQREDLLVLDRLRVVEVMQRLGEVPGQAPKALGALGKALNAEELVLGSYQVVGDRARLTVRVIDAKLGATKKQFQLDRPMADLLKLEDELQGRLPKELGSTEAGGTMRQAKDPRTREMLARAESILTEGNQDSLQVARNFFRSALEIEPDYAPAQAGMAWVLAETGSVLALNQARFQDAQAVLAEAKVHAEKSIALDPSVGRAYRALAAIRVRQGDLDGAARAALQASHLDAGDYRAYDMLADVFASLEGDENHATARRYFEKSLALYPQSWNAYHRLGVLLQNTGQCAEAVKYSEKAVQLRPTAEFAYITAADSLFWLGRTAEGETWVRKGLGQSPSSPILKGLSAYAAAERKAPAEVEKWQQELRGVWPESSATAAFVRGLGPLAKRDLPALQAEWLPYLQKLQTEDIGQKGYNEKRATSVNVYFMARIFSGLGDRANAQAMLELAEKLHPGKKLVAAKDPAFKG
ncbi:MAG: protein kinase [Acidobacteria bacterium]|nr:protein kinase [Acidobacteriota bacterium]